MIKKKIKDFSKELFDKHQEAGLSTKDIFVDYGMKFAKIVKQTNQKTVWGFIALKQFDFGGEQIVPGDLFKAASYKAPAKKKRGNILDNTALYDIWGPLYLNDLKKSTKAKLNIL